MATTNTNIKRILPRDLTPGTVIRINVPPRNNWRIPNEQDCEVVAVEKTRWAGSTKYEIRIRIPDGGVSVRYFGPRDSVAVVEEGD